MKLELRVLLCGLVLQSGLSICFAHDNETMHPKISESAAQSSSGLKNFLSDEFGITNLNKPKIAGNFETNANLGSLDWLKAGSRLEDVPFWRGFNHFYDPTQKPAIGLTDGMDFWANPSFSWATENLTQAGQPSFPWRIVRAYELDALTNSSEAVRETSLAGMMCYLGHVIHLNQDLSVPAHVRNDNHGLTLEHGLRETYIMWTEIYGRDNYSHQDPAKAFPIQKQHQGWGWWQNTAGFQKLEDFWNRDFLTSPNPSAALNADARNDLGQELGLSEFCNGNFISEDATYKECVANPKHTFSYPSLDGTSYGDVRVKELDNVLLSSIHSVFLNNGHLAQRLYLRKERDGIVVTNHSVMSYLGVALAAKGPTPRLSTLAAIRQVSVSVHDTNVLQEYHERLVPKAIEYSAGILDYFFRGTMEVSASYDADAHQCTVTNLNTSGQDFHGGGFFCFGEGTHGVRTLLASKDWTENTLANGDSMTMTFDGPIPPGARLLSVYQGTIGWANDDALDPVDKGIGIAFGRSWIEQIKAYSYEPSLDELGLQPGATITTNLESDDFAFTPAAGNYEVKINYADFDDKGTIGSIASSGPVTSCTYAGEITNTIVPLNEVTVVGNHLRVPVTATDDPACADEIGWRRIVITWRAWPVNAP